MDVEQALKDQLEAARKELNNVYSSASWRLGTKLVRAVRIPLRILGRSVQESNLPFVEVRGWNPTINGVVHFSGTPTDSIHLVLSIDEVDVGDITVFRSSGDETSAFEIGYPLSVEIRGRASVKLRHSGRGPSLTPDEGSVIPRQIDRARNTIQRISGDVTGLRTSVENGRSVAIISTYRPPTRPLTSLLRLIKSFRDAAVEVIVVDTSESPIQHDIEVLLDVCALYVQRKNIGWDFASWLSVIAEFPWLEADGHQIILTNDSNFGPISSIEDLFAKAKNQMPSADVWGLTESHQHSPHLQSYFVVFERAAVQRGFLGVFANEYKFPVNKESIIARGEVALTNAALEAGLRVGALIPYTKVVDEFRRTFEHRLKGLVHDDPATAFRASHGLLGDAYAVSFLLALRDDIRNGVPLNPTHHFWDIVLALGSPFIKRELVLRNPVPVPALREEVIKVVPSFLLEEIDRELNPLGCSGWS